MPIQDMDGLANVQFKQIQELLWEGQTDWDNAFDRQGIVSRGYGDYTANDMQLGYDTNHPPFDTGLKSYLTFHEDSGTTATDVSGNGNDGDIDSINLGQTGLLNATSFDFDPSNNPRVRYSSPILSDTELDGPFTLNIWANINTNRSAMQYFWHRGIDSDSVGDSTYGIIETRDEDQNDYSAYVDGNWSGGQTVTIPTNQWVMFTLVYEGTSDGTTRAYLNGTQEGTTSSTTWDNSKGSLERHGGPDDSANNIRWVDGRMCEAASWNRALSSSEVQTLYDTMSSGYLTTTTKSFSSPVKPNLVNLDYTLNAQSTTLDVIGSPGTGDEEIVSQTLDGATSYGLTWAASHQDFRVKTNHSTSDPTTSPIMRAIGLSTA